MSLYDSIIKVINKYNNDEQLIERVREIIYNGDNPITVNFTYEDEDEFLSKFIDYLKWSNLSLLYDLIKLYIDHPNFKRIMIRESIIDCIANHYQYNHDSPANKAIQLEIFRLIWNNAKISPETDFITRCNITSSDLLKIIFSNPEFRYILYFNGYIEYIDAMAKAFIDRDPHQFICLLESNMIDPSAQNNQKYTILHLMCLWNYTWPHVLKLYMDHPKFSPNIVNNIQFTILDYICMNLNEKNINASYDFAVNFLEHPHIMKLPKNPVNRINSNILSIINDNLRKFIKLLLNSGVINIDAVTMFGSDSFEYVCECATDIELIRIFLEHPDISSSLKKSNYLKNALGNNKNIFEFLLKDDRIDLSSHENNIHILFGAIKNGNITATKLILDHQSIKFFPPVPQSNFHFTENMYDILVELSQHPKSSSLFDFDVPLHMNDKLYFFQCIYSNSASVSPNEMTKITEFLLSKCTHDLFIANCNSLLYVVCKHGLYSSFMCILNAYPFLDLSDFKLIHHACSFTLFGNQDVFTQHLMEATKLIKFLGSQPQIKCQLTTINQYGETLFHIVCKSYNNIEIFETLLEMYEDIIINDPMFINTKNATGKTMFNVAVGHSIYGNSEFKRFIQFIKRLLKCPFIDFITPDTIQLTPIYYFCASISYGNNISQESIIEAKLLIEYMIENIEGIIVPLCSIYHDHRIDLILNKFRNKI